MEFVNKFRFWGTDKPHGYYPLSKKNPWLHCYYDHWPPPLTALDPSPKPVNGLSLTCHNGGFQGRLRRGYGWWIGFLVSSLGSQTEFRLAERGNSAVISSARFVPCLQDIHVKKRERGEKKLHGIWLMRGLLSRGYNLMVDLLIYKPFNPFTLPTPQLYVETPTLLSCHCPSGVATISVIDPSRPSLSVCLVLNCNWG